jgi:hypothetical protein
MIFSDDPPFPRVIWRVLLDVCQITSDLPPVIS